MKKYIAAILLLFVLFSCLLIDLANSQVTVTQRSSVIPTYEVKEADPNPVFYNGRRYQGAQGRVYPYPLIHNLTNNRIDQAYHEIILENEYVEISILPELGGRINYARDKRNGYNYLYHNEVVKPALIGMTGAWISGGVEWNIPHHHRATSFTPVDYTITEHPDGSKTVWVGETEWRHRSRWVVGVTLHPGSTLFETTIRVFNTTPFQNSILIFANAAVHANENYQVIFPPETQWSTYHRKNQFSQWPVSYQFFDGADYTEGVDVSMWKNHSKPTSFFEWGNKGDFIAGIDHGKKAGTVIFGNKHVNPGKKLWSWGNNPNGAMWDNLLTDENGPYIELMFGSYSDNQPDYSWMQTRETKEATYWFGPLKDINNVKKVNRHAAVTFDSEEGSVHIGIHPNRLVEDAEIQITSGNTVLFSEQTDLHPNEPYVNHVDMPDGYEIYDLILIIKDAFGAPLLAATPLQVIEEPMPEPVSPLQDVESIQDADSLYYQGLYYEQFHDAFYQPRDFYKRAIELNPQHVPALLHTGLLYLKDGDYERAAAYLERTVARVAWDYVTPKSGGPLYYLALTYHELGRSEEAYDLLYKASWDYNFRTAAHFQKAQMKSLDGDYERALQHLEEAYATNMLSVDVLAFKASLYRLTEQPDKAEDAITKLLKTDPLNFRGYYETFLLSGDRAVWDQLTVLMRNSRENYLELAVQYGNAGLYDEALDLLQYSLELGDEHLNSYPIIHYYLGYYYHLGGNSAAAREHFLAAGEKPHESVFPFRFETVKALKAALEYNPEDGHAWYYMGNIYYDFQPERAIEAWEQAVALNEQIPVAHRNLAFAYANVGHDLEATMHNIRRALELNPNDPRYYYEHDVYLKTMGATPSERLVPFADHHDLVTSDLTSLFPYVELLTLTGKYDDAIDLMKRYHFRRWEGGGGVYPYWIYAHLNKAVAALEQNPFDVVEAYLQASVSYPGNLQTVSSQFENIAYYYKGILAEKRDNRQQAEAFFERAALGRNRAPECRFYAAKAYEKLQEQGQAESIYLELIRSGRQDLDGEAAVDFFDPFSQVRSGNELKAEDYFKMALGYLGLNDREQAYKYYEQALEFNPALLSLEFSEPQNATELH